MDSIQISQSANQGTWFVVQPQPGQTTTSMAGTPITNEMAVRSLLQAGRPVYNLTGVSQRGELVFSEVITWPEGE